MFATMLQIGLKTVNTSIASTSCERSILVIITKIWKPSHSLRLIWRLGFSNDIKINRQQSRSFQETSTPTKWLRSSLPETISQFYEKYSSEDTQDNW